MLLARFVFWEALHRLALAASALRWGADVTLTPESSWTRRAAWRLGVRANAIAVRREKEAFRAMSLGCENWACSERGRIASDWVATPQALYACVTCERPLGRFSSRR